MLIVMRQDAAESEVQRVCDVIVEMGYQALPMPGKQRTTVGLGHLLTKAEPADGPVATEPGNSPSQ